MNEVLIMNMEIGCFDGQILSKRTLKASRYEEGKNRTYIFLVEFAVDSGDDHLARLSNGRNPSSSRPMSPATVPCYSEILGVPLTSVSEPFVELALDLVSLPGGAGVLLFSSA